MRQFLPVMQGLWHAHAHLAAHRLAAVASARPATLRSRVRPSRCKVPLFWAQRFTATTRLSQSASGQAETIPSPAMSPNIHKRRAICGFINGRTSSRTPAASPLPAHSYAPVARLRLPNMEHSTHSNTALSGPLRICKHFELSEPHMHTSIPMVTFPERAPRSQRVNQAFNRKAGCTRRPGALASALRRSPCFRSSGKSSIPIQDRGKQLAERRQRTGRSRPAFQGLRSRTTRAQPAGRSGRRWRLS